MSWSNSVSPGNDYFNDMSQEIPKDNRRSSDSPHGRALNNMNLNSNDPHGSVPRPKRIACVICRKRKLKCDGNKPSCATCSRLGHECAYDEVRKKSGPKRGYVKALEARLAQVETLLKTQDPQERPVNDAMVEDGTTSLQSQQNTGSLNGGSVSVETGRAGDSRSGSSTKSPFEPVSLESALGGSDAYTWDMIGLGIEEPLPIQEVVDELTQIYFDKIHPSLPMIHRRRYLTAMSLTPHIRPPVCLRYAMWSLAASVTDKYSSLAEHFYRRARKYVEADEMKGHGEATLTIAQAQCWSLIANYEFKLMYFPKAWMSTGRATRLAQMMGLHRLDGAGLDVKQCLSPPKDWTEKEERRRTFWIAFCQDRYASIGTGWPMMVEERDILTSLPSTEEAFENGKAQTTVMLKDAMSLTGALSVSSFGGVVLMASLFGRNLLHLHRPGEDDCEEDLNGEFWKRHRQMDNILLNTSLSMPGHFRLPNGITDANVVFLNMCIHTSTICLHQAAIFKADKNRLPATVSSESKVRCITAAAEIASIMRMTSHVDPSGMHPFLSFCLYVAARVFVQYLKSRPGDQQILASLQFLLSAMQIMKRRNPLTESFLVQLDVDLEGTGLDDPLSNSRFSYGMKKGVPEVATNVDTTECSPMFNLIKSNTVTALFSPEPTNAESGIVNEISPNLPFQANTAPSPTAGINLPSRNKPTPDYAYSGRSQHPPMPGIFPSQTERNSFMKQRSPPFHADMDLSPEPSGASSMDTKHQHPSPSNSSASHNGASSHSSFTPPYEDRPDQAQAQAQDPARFFPQTQTGDFSTVTGLTPGQFIPQTPGKESNSPFIMPRGWDFEVPGVGADAEGMFTQMMEVSGWTESGFIAHDSGGMGQR